MYLALLAIEELIQLEVTHRVVPQCVGLDILEKFTIMSVLLTYIEEMLNSVQAFVVAEHVHEVMLLFRHTL